MDFCTCIVTLGGDSRSQVHILPHKAVSYAEVVLLRVVHGGAETVRDVQVVRREEVNPGAEKSYLMSKYDPNIVNDLYPGVHPTMPASAQDDPYPAAVPVAVAEEEAPKPKPKGRGRASESTTEAGDGFPA